MLAIVLGVFGLGFLCWLLFTLAIYALPFLAGLTAGLASFDSGGGVVGALIVGFLAGGATLALGQIGFVSTRTPLLRVIIGLLYAVPATVAGYQVSFALSGIRASACPHVHRRLADGIRRCRCRSRWRHGLLAHDFVCPGVGRTGRRGNSLADRLAAARPETMTLPAVPSSGLLKVGVEGSS